MTNTLIVLIGVVGSIASILAIWVKDPLLPEKLKERARRRERLSTPEAVAAEVFRVVSSNAAKDVRNARDRLKIGWELTDRTDADRHWEELARVAARWSGEQRSDLEQWRHALRELVTASGEPVEESGLRELILYSMRNARDRLKIGWEFIDKTNGDRPWDEHPRVASRRPNGQRSERQKWRQRLRRLVTPSGDTLEESKLCELLLYGIPTRRMLIVGAAGAGKSYLLNLIAYHWPKAARDDPDIPVPVALSLTSWDPEEQGLMEWIALALTRVHPFLAAPSGDGHSWAAELVWRHRVLPLLDGLDEIDARPETKLKRNEAIFKRRDTILKRIDEVEDGFGLVISCREGHARWLSSACESAVALTPAALDPDAVKTFLHRPGLRSAQAERWREVTDALASTKPSQLREALSTPLMLDFARTVYNQRPGRRNSLGEHPSDLLELDAPSIIDSLLRSFIPAVYAPRDAGELRNADRWSANQAVPWFMFLADHLESRTAHTAETHGRGDDVRRWRATWAARRHALLGLLQRRDDRDEHARQDNVLQDIDWWQLRDSAPRGLLGVIVGVVCGSACGLAAGFGTHVGVGFGIDLGLGIVIALAVGDWFWIYREELRALATKPVDRDPQHADHQGEPEDPYHLGEAVGWTLLAERRVERWLNDTWRRIINTPITPMYGLAGGLAGGVVGGLGAGVLVELGVGHSSGVADSVAAGVGIGLASGPALGLIGGLFGSFFGALLAGEWVGVGVGLPAGVANGLAAGLAVALIIMRAPPPTPTSRPTWRPIGLAGGLMAGIAVGATAWVPAGRSLQAVLPYALLVGTIAGMASGLVGRAVPRVEVSSPCISLKKDRSAFLIIAATAGIGAGVTALAIVGLNTEYELHVTRLHLHTILGTGLLSGIAVGIMAGLVLACVQSPWGEFVVTRWWLAVNRKLPLRLVAFLEDARSADRGVLRTSGPSYRFRHLELQQYLAASASAAWSDSTPPPDNQARRRPGDYG